MQSCGCGFQNNILYTATVNVTEAEMVTIKVIISATYYLYN